MKHEMVQFSEIPSLIKKLKRGLDPHPKILEIHPTDRCNQNCDYCFRKYNNCIYRYLAHIKMVISEMRNYKNKNTNAINLTLPFYRNPFKASFFVEVMFLMKLMLTDDDASGMSSIYKNHCGRWKEERYHIVL